MPSVCPRAVFALILLGSGRVWGLDFSDPATAEPELEALAEEWKDEWGRHPDPEVATELGLTLQALGTVERQAGKPAEALDHLATACDLLARHAPDRLTDAREAKALTLQDLGRLEEAEVLLRQVLDARPQGDSHRLATLDHLALNLLYQARYPEVAPLLKEALDSTPAAAISDRARRLGYRAKLLHTLGSHARAAEALRQAIELPFDDPELRLTLESERALALLRLGDKEKARAGIENAADTARRLYSTKAPFRAVPFINNLGALALQEGRADEALSNFSDALTLLEDQLGPEHPALIQALNNLGVALQAVGDYPAADQALLRAADLQARHLPAVHLRVAETSRNLARNALLEAAPDTMDRIRSATGTGLELLEKLVREGSERERLNFLERFDLVSLPCATGDAEFIANVLLASKARLFDSLLRPGNSIPAPTWGDVQKTLPAHGAFVDTCRFRDPMRSDQELYGAVLILPDGPPHWVRLGDSDSLTRWLSALRKRLQWVAARASGDPGPPPALKLSTILRALEREFWDPFASALPDDTQHIALSPDGALHFVPLAALLDDSNRPLATRFRQVTTVTSGRDLFAPCSDRSLRSSPWAVVTIDEPPIASAPHADDPLAALLAELQPLPGVRDEATRLQAIAPTRSRFLANASATEPAVAQLATGSAVIHFGCHAFFLSDPLPASGPIDFDQRSDLLRSGGLVLHRGALRPGAASAQSADDDLLFPEEIARLPLQTTRLVTLSSCESGAGTPVSGEGLLGLRRAFALAGAKEIVVALWPVSDRSTPQFMDRFYRLALASDRPAQALWQTQGELLGQAADDEALESAVLRYAPFLLSQSAPLADGDPIEADRPARIPWQFWLATLPVVVFLAARLLPRREIPHHKS